MKEYIERAQLLKNLGYDETRRADVLPGSTFDIVLKEPAADVAEVRHGRWKNGICTDCGFDIRCLTDGENDLEEWVWEGLDYCPNCGARMGKEDEHEQ